MNLSHLLPLVAFVVIPTAAAIWNYLSAKKSGEASLKNSTATIINSAIAYALAYNIVFFIQELFLVLGKNWLGLQAYLYHNNHNWLGDHPKEALMQGSGAVAIFILGIAFLVFKNLFNRKSWGYLFSVWIAFQGLMQSLPQFATAKMASDTDTGQALAYLQLSENTGWLITVVSYLLIIILLLYFGKMFLELSPNNQSAINRFVYLKNVVLIAAFVGVILIIPFRIPPMQRAMAPVFLFLATIPLIIGFSWKTANVSAKNNICNQKIIIAPIIALLLLLLFFQGYLSKGILFNP